MFRTFNVPDRVLTFDFSGGRSIRAAKLKSQDPVRDYGVWDAFRLVGVD